MASLSLSLSLSLHEQARSRALVAEMVAVIADSRVLYRQAHVLTCRALPMHGGSDATSLATLIGDAQICLQCIARKSGVPVQQVNRVLVEIARMFRLQIGPHRCDACLEYKTTFSVTQDRRSG